MDFADGGLSKPGLPAVSGVNGKIAGGFGALNGDGLGYGLASIALPLGSRFGLQVDGLLGTDGGDVLGGGAGHLFWRDPSRALLGLYGSYVGYDRADVSTGRAGVEAEYYIGRVSLEGIAGVEFGDGDTDGFGAVNLAFYPLDDLRLYAGYRYVNARNAGAAGVEWQVAGGRIPGLAVFADGRLSENDVWSAFAGVRLYLGDDKSLIRRHREDDPVNNMLVDDLLNRPAAAPACTLQRNFGPNPLKARDQTIRNPCDQDLNAEKG